MHEIVLNKKVAISKVFKVTLFDGICREYIGYRIYSYLWHVVYNMAALMSQIYMVCIQQYYRDFMWKHFN